MRALSVRQPWAWLIVHGYKDVENRTWATDYRGELFIHAGKTFDSDAIEWILHNFPELRGVLPKDKSKYDFGGIVGKVNLLKCVDSYASPWFFGPIGWVFGHAATLTFVPYKGRLGLFDISIVPGKESETKAKDKKGKEINLTWLDEISDYVPEIEDLFEIFSELMSDTPKPLDSFEENENNKAKDQVEGNVQGGPPNDHKGAYEPAGATFKTPNLPPPGDKEEEGSDKGEKKPSSQSEPGLLPIPKPQPDSCPFPGPPLPGMPG